MAVFLPIASRKSLRCVRLVVPTSFSFAPARLMMSGTRKAPPISTSSPRETITLRFRARVSSSSITAAALLLTTVAASAPVSSQISDSTTSSRSPRRPVARSYSSAHGERAAATSASTASSGSGARPRLVCSTVPVRLNTGRSAGRACAPAVAAIRSISSASSGTGAPSRAAARVSSSTRRTRSVTTCRPWRSTDSARAGVSSSRPTAGNRERSVILSSMCASRLVGICGVLTKNPAGWGGVGSGR